jgi:hypothetical protein
VCIQCEKGGLRCSGYDDSNIVYGENVATQQRVELSQGRDAEPIIEMPVSMRSSTLTSFYVGQSLVSMIGSPDRQPPYGWILSLSDVQRSSTASNLAFNALLLARNGQQNGSNDMSLASYRMYNCALAAVARQCSRRNDIAGDDTMAAVLLLALYEVC